MTKENNLKEQFKQAILSTAKVISDDYKIKIDKTLEERLAHMEQIHERIEIKIIEDFDYIYYDDSILLRYFVILL